MNSLGKSNKGFSAIEGLLVVLVITVIGFGGYYVWHTQHQTTSDKTATAPAKTTTAAQPAKPYAGWLSVCSSYGGLCLKYPSSWKLTQQAPILPTYPATGYVITSPSGNVTVNYYPSGTGAYFDTSGSFTNNILSLTSPSSTSDFKVVEQLTTDQASYFADLFVTSNTAIQQQGLVVGKTTTNNEGPQIYIPFTNPNSSNPTASQWLFVDATNNSYPINNTTDAQAWLNTTEVKTARQILSSVSYH